MGPEIEPAPPPPPPPAPHAPRRLTRSSRERMWAGVAGGMAEYFDLDPSLVRLIWVAAAVVSHGLAVPLYFLAWIILPRDDRSPKPGGVQWRDWSQEFHAETQRLAEEARRVASEFQGPTSTTETPVEPTPTAEPQPVTDKGPAPRYEPGASAPWTSSSSGEPAPAPTWSTTTDIDEPRRNGGSPRSAGVVLVGLGAFLLAANAGWFAWFNWGSMWPRQVDWWGR
jgi:phage shock protein C